MPRASDSHWTEWDIVTGNPFVPLFPVGSFTPKSRCPHRGKIRVGSTLVCMVCHASSISNKHPAMQPSPDDPKPEPVEAEAEEREPEARPTPAPATRRQKRAARFGVR